MDKNAKVGGILSIIAGAWGICLGIGLPILFVTLFRFFIDLLSSTAGGTAFPQEFLNIVTTVYSIMGFFYVLLGILAIIGGSFALKRNNWGVALAGAIAASFFTFFIGIPSVIFITLAKGSFSSSKKDNNQ